MKLTIIIVLIVVSLLAGITMGDHLPDATPENQVILSNEYVNALGAVIKNVNLISEHSNAYLHDGILLGEPNAVDGNLLVFNADLGEVVSQTTYRNELLTNGGLLDLTYNLMLDTNNQGLATANLDTDMIMTYSSVDGSTLAGLERATLDIAGNYEWAPDDFRCVFAASEGWIMPSFCNLITTETEFASVTSMAVQTSLELHDTAETAEVPAILIYRVNVDPNSAQGSQYADGQVSATFTASIREAQHPGLGGINNDLYFAPLIANPGWTTNYWDDEARITNYVDTITATGGITKISKRFIYGSSV